MRVKPYFGIIIFHTCKFTFTLLMICFFEECLGKHIWYFISIAQYNTKIYNITTLQPLLQEQAFMNRKGVYKN